MVEIAALRHATTRPVALSTVNPCEGNAVVTVAVSMVTGAVAARKAPSATRAATTAAPIAHFTQGGRRFGPKDFAPRSIWSLERSCEDTLFPGGEVGRELYPRH